MTSLFIYLISYWKKATFCLIFLHTHLLSSEFNLKILRRFLRHPSPKVQLIHLTVLVPHWRLVVHHKFPPLIRRLIIATATIGLYPPPLQLKQRGPVKTVNTHHKQQQQNLLSQLRLLERLQIAIVGAVEDLLAGRVVHLIVGAFLVFVLAVSAAQQRRGEQVFAYW